MYFFYVILTNVDVLFAIVNDFDVREGCSRPILSTQCTHTHQNNRSFQEALNSDFSVKLILVGLP